MMVLATIESMNNKTCKLTLDNCCLNIIISCTYILNHANALTLKPVTI